MKNMPCYVIRDEAFCQDIAILVNCSQADAEEAFMEMIREQINARSDAIWQEWYVTNYEPAKERFLRDWFPHDDIAEMCRLADDYSLYKLDYFVFDMEG